MKCGGPKVGFESCENTAFVFELMIVLRLENKATGRLSHIAWNANILSIIRISSRSPQRVRWTYLFPNLLLFIPYHPVPLWFPLSHTPCSPANSPGYAPNFSNPPRPPAAGEVASMSPNQEMLASRWWASPPWANPPFSPKSQRLRARSPPTLLRL